MNTYDFGRMCQVPVTWELNFEGKDYIGRPPSESRFDHILPEFVTLPDGHILHILQWSEDLPATVQDFRIVEEPSSEILQKAEGNKLSLVTWRK